MFLRKDNTLKWNWIGIGAIITFALVLACILGLDKIIYPLIRNMDCNPWSYGSGFLCSLGVIIGKIFSAKMWLAASFLSVVIFFIYKAVANENDFRYAFIKIKNSYVFYIFSSVLLSLVITGIIKFLIGRSRPVLFDGLGKTSFEPFIFNSVFNSMPSGHTAASFAGLVMIGMLFPKIKWFTWILAIVIGLSRIYVGAHWAGDVIFGAFIGMVSADIIKYWLRKINSK